MSDEFQAWRDALASGQPIAYEKGNPPSGFYRRRFSDRKRNISSCWEVVAIWREGTGVIAQRQYWAGYIINAGDVEELFATCAKSPISEDQYYAVIEKGEQFPDEIPEIAGIGDNSLDPAETMKGDIENLANEAKRWLEKLGGKLSTKDEADRAANFKTKLTELKTASEARRAEEKRPHLEAGRAVDEKWKPIVALAEDSAKVCAGPLAAYLRAEQTRQAEEARIAREAAAKEAREAEAARVAAMADAFAKGEPLPEPEPARAPYVEPAAPAKVSAGTRRGVSLRTRTVYTITDLKAATVFVLDNCTTAPPADLVAAVQTAVNKLMKAGVNCPGVKTEEVDAV